MEDAGISTFVENRAFLCQVENIVTKVIFRHSVVGLRVIRINSDPFASASILIIHNLEIQVWVAGDWRQHHELIQVGARLEKVVVSTLGVNFAVLSDAAEQLDRVEATERLSDKAVLSQHFVSELERRSQDLHDHFPSLL